MRKFLFGFLIFIFSLSTLAQSSTHSVALNWSAPVTTLTVTGYNAYRITGVCPVSISLTTFTKLNSTPITVVNYTDTTVTAGSIYCYTVTAVTAGGESGTPGTLQVTIPFFTASNVAPPPGNFSLTSQ